MVIRLLTYPQLIGLEEYGAYALGMGKSVTTFGVYRNVCCGEEIVIAEGVEFPLIAQITPNCQLNGSRFANEKIQSLLTSLHSRKKRIRPRRFPAATA